MGAPIASKTFKSGNSVALRLPKELGFGPDVEVTLRQLGQSIIVERKRKLTRDEAFDLLLTLPKPETPFKRERIEFPEREWPKPR